MTDPWVALEPGADPAEHARMLRRAHETFTEAGTVTRPVRAVVAESWRRSARAGVGPDGTASVELADGDLGAYRAEHPLARVMPLFRELMGTFAADGEHLLAVCDANGRLLWVEGHPATRRDAGRMNFVPGARWAETATPAAVCVCRTHTASCRAAWIALWITNPAGLTGCGLSESLFPAASTRTRLDAVISSNSMP